MVEIGLLQYNDQSKRLMCIQLLKRVDNTMAQNPEIRKIMNNGDFKKLKETLNNLKSFKAEQNRIDKIRTDTDTEIEKKLQVVPSVFLTPQETEKLISKYSKSIYEEAIQKLSHYKESTGKKYKSDYHAILNWVIEEVGGKPKEDLEKKKVPACPKCGKYKSDYHAILNWVIEEVGGKPKEDLEKKKVPACPKCGKSLANEIKNRSSHCYNPECDADIRGVI